MMFARLRLHFQVAKVPQTLSCVHNLPCNANGRLCMTRQNFSAAASNRNATSSSTTIEPSTSPPNPVGQAYHAIIFKGRGNNQLGLADLRHLLEMIKEPDHVRYAVEGVKHYQKKGNDFSVEICSHFVRACVRGGYPEKAAALMSVRKYRIGAWATATSLHHLIESMLTAPVTETRKGCDWALLLDTLENIHYKGTRPATNTLLMMEPYVRKIAEDDVRARAWRVMLKIGGDIPDIKVPIEDMATSVES